MTIDKMTQRPTTPRRGRGKLRASKSFVTISNGGNEGKILKKAHGLHFTKSVSAPPSAVCEHETLLARSPCFSYHYHLSMWDGTARPLNHPGARLDPSPPLAWRFLAWEKNSCKNRHARRSPSPLIQVRRAPRGWRQDYQCAVVSGPNSDARTVPRE